MISKVDLILSLVIPWLEMRIVLYCTVHYFLLEFTSKISIHFHD